MRLFRSYKMFSYTKSFCKNIAFEWIFWKNKIKMLTYWHWWDMLKMTALEIAYSNWFRQTNERRKIFNVIEWAIDFCIHTFIWWSIFNFQMNFGHYARCYNMHTLQSVIIFNRITIHLKHEFIFSTYLKFSTNFIMIIIKKFRNNSALS